MTKINLDSGVTLADSKGMTKEQINAGLKTVLAIAESIRELGSVPSGHLYAHLMGSLTLESYEKIIQILVNQDLVKKHPSHLLEWIGPAK